MCGVYLMTPLNPTWNKNLLLDDWRKQWKIFTKNMPYKERIELSKICWAVVLWRNLRLEVDNGFIGHFNGPFIQFSMMGANLSWNLVFLEHIFHLLHLLMWKYTWIIEQSITTTFGVDLFECKPKLPYSIFHSIQFRLCLYSFLHYTHNEQYI